MALSKAIIYKGLPADEAYHKITRIIINDITVEDGKRFEVQLMVQCYADSSKSFELSERYFNIQVQSEEGLTYKNFYDTLKKEDFFEGAEDV